MLRQPSSRAAALAAATAASGRTMTARRTLASLTSRQSSSAGAAGRQQLWKMSLALTSSLSYRRSVAGLHSSAVQHAEETIKVPQMAESISEGTLKTWLKKEGDYVQADEEIASIETDKIDVAINAPKAGKIGKFLAKEEDTVQVGQDLYTLDSDAEGGESSGSSSEKSESQPSKSSEDSEPSPATDASKAKDMTQGNNKATEAPKEREVNPEPSNEPSEAKSDNSASAPAPSGDAETIKVPQMAESISEGTLKTWMKKVGDFVKADEEIASIETDKIDVTINAPKSGTIVEILAKEDETVSVGQDLYKLAPGDAPSGGSSSSSKPEPTSPENTASGNRKANESRQEITNKENEPKRPEPKASKPEEVKQPKSQPQSSGKDAKKAEEPKAAQPGARNETRVKMNSMRKRIAERLKQSQNAAASLTTFNEIDMSSLMQMRSQYKDQVLKNHGVKLGFMSAFAKASCLALKEIPAANASIEGPGPGDQIVYRDYVDLSVAVATPKGLVTPVVRNAETMNFLEIEQAIAGLGKKARDNKLTLEDMAGGTFTISNGGVFGSLYGTPIINVPQAAVLGMHSIKDRAVVVDGKIEIRPIMVVALTYDHRLLDGREAVTFLVRVKQYIEDPRFMLLA